MSNYKRENADILCELFPRVVGPFTCRLCETKNGHNELFHRKMVQIQCLLRDIEGHAEADETKFLGPLAQRRVPNTKEWVFFVNDRIRASFIDSIMNINVEKNVFIIDSPDDVLKNDEQFRNDVKDNQFCAVNVYRFGFWDKELTEWELSFGADGFDANCSIHISFPNGRVYVYDFKNEDKYAEGNFHTEYPENEDRQTISTIPDHLRMLFKTNICVKIGFGIFQSLQFLRDYFQIEAWHVVDARYIFLVRTALSYKIKQTSLKNAAKYIVAKDIDKFDASKWAKLVNDRFWASSVLTHLKFPDHGLIILGIIYTCAALIYPKRYVTKLTMDTFITDKLLLDFNDAPFDHNQLNTITNDKGFVDIDFSMSTDALAEFRRAYRTKFHHNTKYPHDNYRRDAFHL